MLKVLQKPKHITAQMKTPLYVRSFTLVGLSAKERKCPHPGEEKCDNILLIQRIRARITKLSQKHKAN
jgi:hypothetical protein